MSNACAIPCPYCGKDIDVIMALEQQAGTEFTAALKGMPYSLVGALMRYLELFKPPKQQLRWSRRLALTLELAPMIQAAQVKRHGIVYPAPAAMWEAEMMKLVINPPESLVLPLTSNGYLLRIIAGRGEAAAAKLEQKKEEQLRNRSNVGGGPVAASTYVSPPKDKPPKSKPPPEFREALNTS